MVLVKRQALIDLCTRDIREATRHNGVHRFAVLKKTNNVMNANPRAFDDRMTATDACLAGNVPITQGYRVPIHSCQNNSNHPLKRALRVSVGKRRALSDGKYVRWQSEAGGSLPKGWAEIESQGGRC